MRRPAAPHLAAELQSRSRGDDERRRHRLLPFLRGVKMRPGDLVRVVRPRIRARRMVGDDAYRAARPAGQLFHLVGRSEGEHDLSGHVFAGVVALLSPFAHIHQVRRHVGGGAVVGHRGWSLPNVAEFDDSRLQQPQLAPFERPALVHSVSRRDPGGEGNELHVLEAIALGARLHPLRFVHEPLRFTAGGVVHHQRPQIVVRDVARDLVGQLVVGLLWQKRALLAQGQSGNAGEHSEQGHQSAHRFLRRKIRQSGLK